MSVTVNGTINATSPAIAEKLRAAIPEHVRLSREEPGNIHFNITATDDPMVWEVDEAFTDAAAFDAHKARMGKAAWADAAVGIERDLKITGYP